MQKFWLNSAQFESMRVESEKNAQAKRLLEVKWKLVNFRVTISRELRSLY